MGKSEATSESDAHLALESDDRLALESDARFERMERVAVLFGEITAATREFLAALAQSDRHKDWAEEGFGSCAEWLAWQIGITKGTANEKVRAARALEHLPLISEAMAKGELSFSKVRALTRAAVPENEAELLEFARAGSAANLERLVRGWKTLSRFDEAQQERIRHGRRCFSVLPDEDGMYVVKGRLDPEVGAALMRAVEAASDALFAGANKGDCEVGFSGQRFTGQARPGNQDTPEPAQLRADAVGLVAERALAAGFGDTAPVSGSRAERYQVVLHVESATLSEAGEPGLSELEDGTRLSAETARRLACDASRVEVRYADLGSGNGSASSSALGSPLGSAPSSPLGSAPSSPLGSAPSSPLGSAPGSPLGSAPGSPDSSVLDVGRKTRTIPPALRRALDVRDRGCRFPGCGLRFTDAHHIVHWADGGETKLDNTLLLCRRHHRTVHEGGYQVCSDRNGQVVFFTPKGSVLFEAPPMPELPADPVGALLRRNHERGITPNSWSGAPRWKKDWDIPWAIEAAAREAVDRWDKPAVGELSVKELSVQERSTSPSSSISVSAEIGTGCLVP